ncbi:VOC family protein [Pendulispora albinea]|uniref:VOC family protein n=1 Tax=Pendulispora albinea TaxID=2741071 RepID=A0ABZ2LWP6_9BACT
MSCKTPGRTIGLLGLGFVAVLGAVSCARPSEPRSSRTMEQHPAPRLEQRLSIVTLGVQNLARMRDFYETKLGWKPVAANKDIVFFKVNGMLFALFGNKELAADAQLSADGSGFRGFTLAYLAHDPAEVDGIFAQLESKGVRIVTRPSKTFFGAYRGYVADIEGNLLEIGYNPLIELDAQGHVVTHRDIRHLEQ